jgi:release factor glutamine methyltransferase
MTAGELLAWGEKFLSARQVPEAKASAEFLLAAALGGGRARVHAGAGDRIPAKGSGEFERFIKARARRTPVAYILGNQPFCGLEIRVTPSVLIPRPETEELVEHAARLARERFDGRPLHILEIGTGSGCISVALAKLLPQATLYATDISSEALELARLNARAHGVEPRIRFLREDLFHPAKAAGWADMLVSNPPYIPSGEIADLDPEVKREPFLALDGGKDGLDAIRAIAQAAPSLLKPGGWLALEIGDGQGRAVRSILDAFADVDVRRDLSGRERFAFARR